MPPAPRMALNDSLRRRGLIPVEVELQTDIEGRIHLRARHVIHWQLDGRERGLIHQWETLLKSRTLRRVTFHEYQRAVLARHGVERK
jgi:hypothetical protein